MDCLNTDDIDAPQSQRNLEEDFLMAIVASDRIENWMQRIRKG